MDTSLIVHQTGTLTVKDMQAFVMDDPKKEVHLTGEFQIIDYNVDNYGGCFYVKSNGWPASREFGIPAEHLPEVGYA